MSRIGRFRNHYSRIQSLSRRFDRVVGDQVDNELMEQLGSQLLRVCRNEFETFEDTVLLSVFSDLLKIDNQDMIRLGTALSNQCPDEDARELLHWIGVSLHSEMAATLARIGSGR